MFLEEVNAQRKIISVLEKAYLPITSKEIVKITGLNPNTTRTYLDNLFNQEEIQKITTGSGSKNYYLNKIVKNEGEIKIIVIGKWIKEDLEKFNDSSEDKVDSEEQDDSTIECNLFQCVGLINFYNLRKICGIHRFRSPNMIMKLGVQRQKHEDWVEQLMEAFQSWNAEMWSTAIIYFDTEKVEYVKLQDYDNQEIGIVSINYDGHVFDADKPGWILDGQQRMWALEYIARNSENPDSKELMGPVTIGIGEFDMDDSKKIDFIRRTFSNSNNTKDLPKNFRADLIATLKESSQKIMTQKDKMEGLIAQIVDDLYSDDDSPFKNKIDITNFGIPRNQGELIARGSINSLIKDILKYAGFHKDNLPISKSDDRFNSNMELIKDYFNAVKFTFFLEWQKPISESRIRSRLVLTSFALLLDKILHISVATSPDRKDRFNVMVRELLKISDDEDVSFDINSPLILNKRNNLGDIKALTETLTKIYTVNAQMIPDKSQIEEIFKNWIEIFPSQD